MGRHRLFVLCFLAAAFLPVQGWAQAWVNAEVDTVGDVGLYPAVAVDGAGDAHIAYYDASLDELKYATNASGAWVAEVIDADVGWDAIAYSINYSAPFASIAADSAGKAHVSYYDAVDQEIRFATNASGAWISELIEGTGPVSGADVGIIPSLALDGDDHAHVGYCQALAGGYTGPVRYATNAGGGWVIQTAVASGALYPAGLALALGDDGSVHIAYAYEATPYQGIAYVTNATGPWASETVFEASDPLHQIVYGPSGLCVDSAGDAHIALGAAYVGFSEYTLYVNYMSNASGSWTGENLYTASYPTSVAYMGGIALDSSDAAHVSFGVMSADTPLGSLRHATNASGAWVIETAVAEDAGLFSAIAVDGQDAVHMVHYDPTNQDLEYCTNQAPPPWGAASIAGAARTTATGLVNGLLLLVVPLGVWLVARRRSGER